jgi:hypothetical protein
MRTSFLIFLLLSIAGYSNCFCQRKLPEAVLTIFKNKGLDKQYEIKDYLMPVYWDEDLTGDSIVDIAVCIIEKSSQKKGVLILNGKSNVHFVFGAGTKFGNRLDNFNSAERWALSFQREAEVQVIDPKTGKVKGTKLQKLKHPALRFDDISEGKNNVQGLIYWNGKTYDWIFQGF